MKKERTLEVYLVRMDPLTKPMQVRNDYFFAFAIFHKKLVFIPYATVQSSNNVCVRSYKLDTLEISTTF